MQKKENKNSKTMQSISYTFCHQLFESFEILKRHIKEIHINTVHDGLKVHKCEDYGKFFSGEGSLNKHIYRVNQKDHKCESYGKAYSQAAKLKKHIHT